MSLSLFTCCCNLNILPQSSLVRKELFQLILLGHSLLIVEGYQSRTQGKKLEGGAMEKHRLLVCCLDDAQNIFVLSSDYLTAGVLISGFYNLSVPSSKMVLQA